MSATPEVRYWQHPLAPSGIIPARVGVEMPAPWVEVTVSPVVPQGAATPADETARDQHAMISDVLADVIAVAETADELVPQAVLDAVRERGWALVPLATSPADADTAELEWGVAWTSPNGEETVERMKDREAAERWMDPAHWEVLPEGGFRLVSRTPWRTTTTSSNTDTNEKSDR